MDAKKYFPIEGKKYLKITTSYNKGGYNYWNGKQEPRGYRVVFRTVEKESREGVTIESFFIYGEKLDFSLLYKEVARKAPKVEKELTEKIENLPDRTLQKYLEGDRDFFRSYFYH